LDVGNEYQFKVVDESGNEWVTANKRVEQRVRTARVHNLKVNSSTLSLTFETEPGARYIVKVSESLGADAQWEIENVQIAHPVFPSGFSQAMQEVPGAPGTQTTVRMQRNRKCAFFKVIRLD